MRRVLWTRESERVLEIRHTDGAAQLQKVAEVRSRMDLDMQFASPRDTGSIPGTETIIDSPQ
jgi:hypothetical protein